MSRQHRMAATWAACLLGLGACQAPRGPSAEAPAKAADPPPIVAAPEPVAQAPEPYQETRQIMSTVIGITVLDTPEALARKAADAAFREIEGLEQILSEWRDDSEISRINQNAGVAPVQVGPHTLAVVKAGLEVSRWSEGAFDISWAAMRGLYSFQEGEERVPSDAEIAEKLPRIRYQDIVLDETAHTVMLKRKGMAIGTGGIAKGYALDRAGAVLRSSGIENYMLFGGGQVQVAGKKAGRPWRVGIQHPRKPDYFAMLEAEGGSISTSGDYEHAFIRDGVRWHHIVDPRTGRPVQHTASVTVIADSGLYADALSTAVFVLGAKRALEKLASAPAHAQAVVVDTDLTLHESEGLRPRVVLRAPLQDGKVPP